MNTTFLSVIYFVALSHAIMLVIALCTRSAKGSPNRILAIVVALLAYKLYEGGASYSGLYQYLPHTLDLMPAIVMVLGPVFYGYVRFVTGQKPFGWKDWLLHLSPWVAFWCVLNAAYVFRSADAKIAMWQHIVSTTSDNTQLPSDIILRLLAIKAHLTTYLWLSSRSLFRVGQSVNNLRSDNSAEILTQLRWLTVSFILLEVTWVSLFIAQQYFDVGTLSLVSDIWLLLIALIILAMGLSGLQKPDMIFSPEEHLLASTEHAGIRPVSTDLDNEKIKYIHSLLPETTADDIAKLIEDALENKQLYLNDKLALTDLAKALDLKSHTLSQVINQRMQTNFYKLINSFRIQHAVNFLENPSVNWPIERIALESGFSNRVTFNKAFKEQLGCTASDFRKKHRKAS